MAAAAVVAMNATLTGLPTGTKTVAIPVTVATPVDASQVFTTLSGANTITPPVGATAVCIIPPSGNVTSITLKGVTGDTGVPLSLTNPTWLSLVASPGTFVLTTGGIIVGVELFYI